MIADEFIENQIKKSKLYGWSTHMSPPPTTAQEGLDILIEHFIGKEWHSTIPMCQEQVNTEAIYNILEKYNKKKLIKNGDCINPEKFIENIINKNDLDKYDDICPPPINAQEGLNVLVEHFIGKSWCLMAPVFSKQQNNTFVIHEILIQYPKKKSFKHIIKSIRRKYNGNDF